MKGKFVIYSGGCRSLNKRLDLALMSLVGVNASITYIPVTEDQDDSYFLNFKKYYNHYGIKSIKYLAPDKKYSKSYVDRAFNSSIIYLDGGNTYLFLKNIEKSGFKSRLIAFLDKGGVIAGQSAGIITLSPNINTASIPSRDADDIIPGFNKKTALNLLAFEFSPHFDINNINGIKELKEYSVKTKNRIFACDDGSGIIVVDGKLSVVGKVFRFHQGKKTKI